VFNIRANYKLIILVIIVAIAIFIPAKLAGLTSERESQQYEILSAPKVLAYVPEPKEVSKPAQDVITMIVQSTAYTHTGYMTFTETWPKFGTIAVDPKVIPLGSIIEVPGYGIGVAEDTGGLIKGDIIDVFMETEKEAITWGRRLVKIRVILPEAGQ